MVLSELATLIRDLQSAWKIATVYHTGKVPGSSVALTDEIKASMRTERNELKASVKALSLKFDTETIDE